MIMVGEIRDAETAEIAVQAALTGHLVFSTLHTNDAAGAISRLLEMGVQDYLLSSSLLGCSSAATSCAGSVLIAEKRFRLPGLDGNEPEMALPNSEACKRSGTRWVAIGAAAPDTSAVSGSLSFCR